MCIYTMSDAPEFVLVVQYNRVFADSKVHVELQKFIVQLVFLSLCIYIDALSSELNYIFSIHVLCTYMEYGSSSYKPNSSPRYSQ